MPTNKPKLSHRNILQKNIIAALFFFSCYGLAQAEDFSNIGSSNTKIIEFNDAELHTYDNVHIEHSPKITNSQFSILLRGGADLKVNKNTEIRINATEFDDSSFEQGNYAIAAYQGSEINLNGNVDIFVYQKTNHPKFNPKEIGANGIWLQDAIINIGTAGSTTKIWTFAQKADTLQAKGKSKINIRSTNNQIVGNILVEQNSSVTGTFIGNGYFSGDDFLLDNQDWVGWIGDFGDGRDKYIAGDLNLTFENGAQWIYLKSPYISQITLNNNGVINLFDQDIQEFYSSSELSEYFSDEILSINHNYVHIANLQGNGGIFKMDLNAEDKSASDMLFIDSYNGSENQTFSKHAIDLVAHDLGLLESINPNNTLIFAVTKPNDESTLSFVDKVNERGEGLIDYELQINYETLSEEDTQRDEFSTVKDTEGSTVDLDDYIGGTKWFIERIVLTKSSAAFGMTGAGYASYDAAVEMDRRDRRLNETLRSDDDPDNGLWIRMHHGRSGADSQYHWDRTGVSIGYDRQFSQKSRAGVWFSYTEGDTNFLDVQGNGEMKRYEFAVFDTLTYDNHYLDFVGRIGRVSSDYTVGNETYTTKGDFDQDYVALSAEYGYTLKDSKGVFLEPQLQIQVAYLDSFDYWTDRRMKVEADSETSVIGRVGFRAGHEFLSQNFAGEFYFRGDVLHQFTGGQDAKLSDGLHNLKENWGNTGTWADFGIGTALNWENNIHLQFDAERIVGGKTEDTWLVFGHMKYLF